MSLQARIPSGPLEDKWTSHRNSVRLVAPANRRKFTVIVVGTGLAGGSAAATLAELGYRVKCFTFHDSARRAHSIAAQGGINAAKNYRNDGDSIQRLFYDTIKGGDFRSREANVYRLAEVSLNIIDQCVAQGVPFARDYGGLLANRSFGGAQVSRTFYARGQTGQQLLLGAYQALARQVDRGQVEFHPRTEMLDVVIVDGRARGIVTRNLTGTLAHASPAEPVVFTRREMEILVYLHANCERPVSREELLNQVWGYAKNLDIETRTVDIHIAKLRRKIEPNPKEPIFLCTVRGAGYRLASDSTGK